MSKEEILDYVMNSPENTNKAVLSSMLDGMGGDSSDFSTANVTFINNSESSIRTSCMVIYNDDGEYVEYNFGSDSSITAEGKIVLFKGSALLVWSNPDASYTGTGDVEIENNETVITGNCTITAS